MTRLNVDTRKAMVRKALTVAGIDGDLADLVTRRAALAEAIRVDALGGPEAVKAIEREMKAIAKKAASKNLSNVCGYYVKAARTRHALDYINLGGMRVNLQYNGQHSEYPNIPADRVKKTPVPSEVTYDAEHRFTKEFLAIEADFETVTGRREGLRAQVRATLDQFTTVEKLLKAWPEASELLPDELGKPKAQLPVVQTKDLNCLLGLPTEGGE